MLSMRCLVMLSFKTPDIHPVKCYALLKQEGSTEAPETPKLHPLCLFTCGNYQTMLSDFQCTYICTLHNSLWAYQCVTKSGKMKAQDYFILITFLKCSGSSKYSQFSMSHTIRIEPNRLNRLISKKKKLVAARLGLQRSCLFLAPYSGRLELL